MSDTEFYVSNRNHYVDFPDLSPEEVKELVRVSTGISLDEHFAEIQESVRRDCADNCCYSADCAARGSGTIILAECGITYKAGCLESDEEHFERAIAPIKAAFED